jgi:hypothetical protein
MDQLNQYFFLVLIILIEMYALIINLDQNQDENIAFFTQFIFITFEHKDNKVKNESTVGAFNPTCSDLDEIWHNELTNT